MSILLVGISTDLGSLLVSRLVSLGDEVRVICPDGEAARTWERLGAHVARGDGTDPDLVERAARGVRTLVVAASERGARPAVLDAVIEAARGAAGGVRLVVCLTGSQRDAAEVVRSSGLEFVLLRTKRGRGLVPWTGRPPLRAVVEAINAADDLAGSPRLDLDLTTPEGWRPLGLEPPGARLEPGDGEEHPQD
jgi:uncharacterized protein YbjT (DUF2867 family)